MSVQGQLKPDDRREGDESFASRNAGSIIGIIALGFIILATIWTMFRGP